MKAMSKAINNRKKRYLIIGSLIAISIFILASYVSAQMSYSDCNVYGMCKVAKPTIQTLGTLPLYSIAPTCSQALRGQTIILTGVGGVADIEQVCVKTILDTYVWKVVGLT